MSDRLLAHYGRKVEEFGSSRFGDVEDDGTDDLGAFGYLRGQRERAVMLELRRKDGNIRAIGYAWLERVDFDRSNGILLYVSNQRIRLLGRNLNAEVRPNVRLFEGITRHRITWVQEADEPAAMQADRQATVIERIDW